MFTWKFGKIEKYAGTIEDINISITVQEFVYTIGKLIPDFQATIIFMTESTKYQDNFINIKQVAQEMFNSSFNVNEYDENCIFLMISTYFKYSEYGILLVCIPVCPCYPHSRIIVNIDSFTDK